MQSVIEARRQQFGLALGDYSLAVANDAESELCDLRVLIQRQSARRLRWAAIAPETKEKGHAVSESLAVGSGVVFLTAVRWRLRKFHRKSEMNWPTQTCTNLQVLEFGGA